MCRWGQCLPVLTPTYLWLRYVVSQTILLIALLYMASGFVLAQSQDYINATITANLSNVETRVTQLDARVATIDDRMWYVLAGVAGSLAVQLLNLRNTYRKEK